MNTLMCVLRMKNSKEFLKDKQIRIWVNSSYDFSQEKVRQCIDRKTEVSVLQF